VLRLSLINIDEFSTMVLIIWSGLFWAAFMGLMGQGQAYSCLRGEKTGKKKLNNIKFYVEFYFMCIRQVFQKKKKIIFVYSIIVKKKKTFVFLVCLFKKIRRQKIIFYILAFYKNTCHNIKI